VTDLAELMQRRMALIEKLSALNSKQLLNTTTRSGIEVELTGCIEEIEKNGETPEMLAQLAEVEARYRTATAASADCDRELDDLTDQLTSLDQAGPAA